MNYQEASVQKSLQSLIPLLTQLRLLLPLRPQLPLRQQDQRHLVAPAVLQHLPGQQHQLVQQPLLVPQVPLRLQVLVDQQHLRLQLHQ